MCCLLVLVVVFAQQLLGPYVKGQVELVLQQRFGGVWRVDAVERLDLNGAELRGIQLIKPEAHSKFQAIEVEQIAMNWDPWQVWYDPLAGLDSVQLGHVHVACDVSRTNWLTGARTDSEPSSFSLAMYQEHAQEIIQFFDQFNTEFRTSAIIQAEWYGAGSGTAEFMIDWKEGALDLQEVSIEHQEALVVIDQLSWHPRKGLQRLGRARVRNVDLGEWYGSSIGTLEASFYLEDQRLLMAVDIEGDLIRADWHGSLVTGLALDRWHLANLRGEGQMDLSLPKPLNGSLRTFFALQGTLADPQFDFLLSAKSLQWGDWPQMNADLTIRASDRTLRIPLVEVSTTQWSYRGQDVARFRWDHDGSWDVQGQPRLDYLTDMSSTEGKRPDIQMDLRGNLEGIEEGSIRMRNFRLSWFGPLAPVFNASPTRIGLDLRLDNFGEKLRGSIEFDNLLRRGDQHLSLGVDVINSPKGLEFEVTPAESGDASHVSGHGYIQGPIRSSWSEISSLLDRHTEAQLALEAFPLEFLATLFPQVDFAGGVADGRLSLVGNLRDVTPQATLSLRDGNMRVSDRFPPLTAIHGDVVLSPGQLDIAGVHGELGYGPIEIRGRVSLDPQREHDFQVLAEQALVRSQSDLRVRLDGRIQVTGFPTSPLLTGHVAVSDMVYSPPESWWQLGVQAGQRVRINDPLTQLFSMNEEPWKSMRFDVTVYDGRLDSWADTQSRVWILSHFARLPLRLDMHLRGTGALPEPSGTVSARRGTINLPFTSYRVDNAVLIFPENSPFEPRIEASLRTRMVGYDVRLLVTGLLSDPRVTVSTSPPLPTNQALLLATTGIPPSETENTQQAALSVAIPFLINQIREAVFGLQDPDSGPSSWDRFQMVLGEERSENGLTSARIEFFVGRRFYLYAERDGFENYNGGILWRRMLGDDASENPLVYTQAEQVERLPIDWLVRPVDTTEQFSPTPRQLLNLVKRQRRNFDAGMGELLHASDAAARMTLILREKGYAWATVDVTPIFESDSLQQVEFWVQAGPKWFWGESWIEGAPADLAEELADLTAGHLAARKVFNQRRIDALHSDITEVLRLNGYTQADVDIAVSALSPEAPRVQAAVRIIPGQRYVFGHVTLSGIRDLPPELQQQLREQSSGLMGTPWLRRSAVALRARLVGILQDEGYYWAQVDAELADPDDGKTHAAPVHFTVKSGPIAVIRSVVVEGLNRTSYRYSRKRLQLNEGELITKEGLDQAASRLRTTVPLRRLEIEVTPVGAQAATQDADILVKLDEGPSRFFEAYTGYGSYEGIRGGVRYIDNHVLGHGRQWTIGAHGSQKHVLGRTAVSDSDILGGERRLSLAIEGGFREEPSFDQASLEFNPEAFIPLTDDMDLTIGYRLEFSRTTNVVAATTAEDLDESTQRVAMVDIDWSLARLDDPWLPTSGYHLELGLGVADRALGSSRDFIEVRGRLGGLVSFDDVGKWGLAGLIGYTSRKTLDGDETLPIAERIFLGGANSVRSFERDLLGPGPSGEPTGGLTSAFAQVELRIPVYDNLRAALFYDVGTVSEKSWEIDADNGVGHGVGFGIRYHLPVGPLRLDMAYNPGDKLAANSRYAVQFAVGFTF